jgi:FixJ family two-component response regulator
MAFRDDRETPRACVISDQDMPHMMGLELVSQLNSKGIGLPILLISASLASDMVARAAEFGTEEVIGKRMDESDVFRFIGVHQ